MKKIVLLIFTVWFSGFPLITYACNTNSADVSGAVNYLYADDSVSLSPTDEITLEAWIRFTSDPETGDEKHILGKAHNATNDTRSYLLRYIPGAGLYTTYYTSTAIGRQCNTTAFTPSIDVWYHIASVIDASAASITVYIDGTSASISCGNTGTSINDTDSIFTVGRGFDDDAREFPGFIDEVRISSSLRYSGNFTPQTDDYTSDANTIALYHFNTDLTTDSSSNSNTLTNVNTVVQSTTIPYIGSCAGAVLRREEIILFD